jgi:hypothetical protein
MEHGAGKLDNLLHSILLCIPTNSIDNGDFNILYISHNNDNGGNESICTRFDTPLQHNNKSIDNVDFNSSSACNNSNNGGNEKFHTCL